MTTNAQYAEVDARSQDRIARERLGITRRRLGAICRRWGIVELSAFGSILRSDFSNASDVDLLVRFESGRRPDMSDLVGAEAAFADAAGRSVDLLTRSSIERSQNGPRRERILGSALILWRARGATEHAFKSIGSRSAALQLAEPGGAWRDEDAALDVLIAARHVRSFMADMTSMDDLAANQLVLSAVLRQLTVMGEAAKRVSPAFRRDHPGIAWKEMAGMRDRLVHGYDDVDLVTVWQVAVELVPGLIARLEGIVED